MAPEKFLRGSVLI